MVDKYGHLSFGVNRKHSLRGRRELHRIMTAQKSDHISRKIAGLRRAEKIVAAAYAAHPHHNEKRLQRLRELNK